MRRVVCSMMALATLFALELGAQASKPATARFNSRGGHVRYAGAHIAAEPPALTRRACLDGRNCDSFLVTISLPAGFYAAHDRVLTMTISWVSKDSDLDLYVCKGTEQSDPQCLNGLQGSSIAEGTTSESVSLGAPEAGTYRVIAAAASGASAYSGAVTFAAPPPVPTLRSRSGAFGWRSTAVSQASSFAEPSVDVDHTGRIYVTAPGGAGVQLWRSSDGGMTFVHREIGSDGGGGDSEIEFLSNDIGFTADLRITDSAISRTMDHFNSWTQQGVGIEQDRQWLAHRCDRAVFLGYHDFVVEAELINKSNDGGRTWDRIPTPVSPPNSAPGSQDVQLLADQQVNTFSGPVVVDQRTGDVYVVFAISSAQGNLTTGIPPYGEPEQVVVGVSHDEGKTFHLRLIRGGGPGTLAGVIFPWITVDRAGTVYASWAGRAKSSDPINVFLAHSNDHGEHWSAPVTVNGDRTGHAHVYTTISAGAPGVVDVAWYTASTPDPSSARNEWFVDFAQVTGAAGSHPRISRSRVYPRSIHHGDICLNGILCLAGGDRSLLDFFQIQIGPDGVANIAFANNRTPDGQLRVWFARQTGGPRAGSGLHDAEWCPKRKR